MADEFESDVIGASALELATTSADAPRLTLATWRQGKGRRMIRRVNHFGGQTAAPPAFLAMREKVCFKPGRPGYRVCSAMKKDGNPCGMLALKGMKVCLAHGGQAALARQGRYQPSGRAAAAIAAKEAKAAEMARSKMPEDRVPDVPPFELTRLRLYIEANEWTRLRFIRAWGTEGWHDLVRQLRSRDDPPDDDRNR